MNARHPSSAARSGQIRPSQRLERVRSSAVRDLLAHARRPDMISFAKGITSGYFPLGGVGLSDAIVAEID